MKKLNKVLLAICAPFMLEMAAHSSNFAKGIACQPLYKGSSLTAEFQSKRSLDQEPITMRVASVPRVGFNFTVCSAADARASLTFVPQNPTGDVGESQYLFAAYCNLRTVNKFTGQPDGVLDISSSTFAPGTNNLGTADPWITHNRFTGQWSFTYELYNADTGEPDNLNFQVSNTDTITPATVWSYYQLPSSQINPLGGGAGSFIDYQQPAYDQNATYNGVATFDTNGNFLGSSLTIIPNSSLVAGAPTITIFPGLFPETVGPELEGYAAPATNFDENPTYGYFLWTLYDQPDGIIGNQIGLYRILDAGTDMPTLGPLVTITLPFNFAYNGLNASHKENLLGSAALLQVPDSMSPGMHVRNHQLYFAQCVQIDDTGTADTSGDRIGICWYQFDLTGDDTGQGLETENPDTIPVLIQSGMLFDDSATDPLFYNMPALMTNKNGDMIISFCSSGVNNYINAGYAFRAASDAPGMLQAPVYVTNSSFPQNYNGNLSENPGPNVQRWGDQGTAVVDPSNDLDFWLTQSYSALQNAWGMQTTQVILS